MGRGGVKCTKDYACTNCTHTHEHKLLTYIRLGKQSNRYIHINEKGNTNYIYLSQASFLWDIVILCKPRSDAAELGI